MDTRALTVFLAVAESLNFSRSAEQLHMSVSAVSRTVSRLEDDIGQPLLERDRRSIRLTPAGRDFQAYARREHAETSAADVIAAFEAQGKPCAWRLRTPDEGSTFWYDVVVDKREFQNETLVDRVIFKADGFPTYQFAVVVDDHTMGISHVLRGDDHVSNTPRQILLFKAFGFRVPKFGHMPMILGADKQRLSKRQKACTIFELQRCLSST